MGQRFKNLSFVIALLLVLSILGVSTSAALADRPVKYETVVTQTVVTNDICSFPVTNEATFTFTGIVYFDKDGNLTREFDHVSELDVFSANGKTLTALPYTYNIEWLFDSSGNITNAYVSGEAFRVQLPDGTMVTAAGRVDAMAHPGATFYFPDFGHTDNLDAFCAVLAP